MSAPRQVPVVMTIAGSDSGGGAGIQADLKTFAALGVFGTSAITCITAQNPDRVTAVEAVSPRMVANQIETVCAGFPIAAVKTGMLYSADIIHAAAHTIRACRLVNLVVDPVMISTSGAALLRDDAVETLLSELIPLAAVVTPNVPEAEVLCGHAIRTRDELAAAAREIGDRFGVACAAKGGHLEAGARGEVVDVLYAGGETTVLTSERVNANETHGTGCTFSAALAACLAQGCTLEAAFARAKRFVGEALAGAVQAGGHYPLGIR